MGMSFGHIALLLVVVLVVFGAGRLPQVMGDLGKGIKSFKDGLKEGEAEKTSLLLPNDSQNEDLKA